MALKAAIRVLQLVIARDAKTTQEIDTVFSEQEIAFLQILAPTLEGNTEKLKNPHQVSDVKFAIWVIA